MKIELNFPCCSWSCGRKSRASFKLSSCLLERRSCLDARIEPLYIYKICLLFYERCWTYFITIHSKAAGEIWSQNRISFDCFVLGNLLICGIRSILSEIKLWALAVDFFCTLRKKSRCIFLSFLNVLHTTFYSVLCRILIGHATHVRMLHIYFFVYRAGYPSKSALQLSEELSLVCRCR